MGYPNVLEKLGTVFPTEQSLLDSTFAARLNGFVKGFGTRDQIVNEIQHWQVSENARQQLIEQFLKIKW